ncbi:hypothetical protein [Streptomyces sp. NPDC000229]|uniref:hypothetical protein n=1 Tax=Streptomyces sp. NPDC000229 TaxID=3154247 RepID=UPI00332FFAEF
MNLEAALFYVLDALIVYAAHIAANFAFVMLCLCAVVIGGFTLWQRRRAPRPAGDEGAEEVGLSGFRWEEGDER